MGQFRYARKRVAIAPATEPPKIMDYIHPAHGNACTTLAPRRQKTPQKSYPEANLDWCTFYIHLYVRACAWMGVLFVNKLSSAKVQVFGSLAPSSSTLFLFFSSWHETIYACLGQKNSSLLSVASISQGPPQPMPIPGVYKWQPPWFLSFFFFFFFFFFLYNWARACCHKINIRESIPCFARPFWSKEYYYHQKRYKFPNHDKVQAARGLDSHHWQMDDETKHAWHFILYFLFGFNLRMIQEYSLWLPAHHMYTSLPCNY
mgnify:CR=1 FL=1